MYSVLLNYTKNPVSLFTSRSKGGKCGTVSGEYFVCFSWRVYWEMRTFFQLVPISPLIIISVLHKLVWTSTRKEHEGIEIRVHPIYFFSWKLLWDSLVYKNLLLDLLYQLWDRLKQSFRFRYWRYIERIPNHVPFMERNSQPRQQFTQRTIVVSPSDIDLAVYEAPYLSTFNCLG